MVVLEGKLGGGPTNHLAGLRVVSGALFLGSSRVHSTLLVACERLPRTGTARRKRTSGVLDWRGKHTCRVGQSSSCRVYINSNHRDSRI
jgi:hypothetical protein